MLIKLSRRGFVGGAAAAIGSITAAAALNACKKPELSCAGDNGLAAADKAQRTAVKYTDHSTEAGKKCEGCVQFTPPPSPGTCGGCKVVKGTIHPEGYCTLYTAKPA
jgi:hypothetical protein